MSNILEVLETAACQNAQTNLNAQQESVLLFNSPGILFISHCSSISLPATNIIQLIYKGVLYQSAEEGNKAKDCRHMENKIREGSENQRLNDERQRNNKKEFDKGSNKQPFLQVKGLLFFHLSMWIS